MDTTLRIVATWMFISLYTGLVIQVDINESIGGWGGLIFSAVATFILWVMWR